MMTPWCAGHPKTRGVDLPQDISSGMQHQMDLMENTFLLFLLLFFPLCSFPPIFFILQHRPLVHTLTLHLSSLPSTLPHTVTTPEMRTHLQTSRLSVFVECLHSSTHLGMMFFGGMLRKLLCIRWVERHRQDVPTFSFFFSFFFKMAAKKNRRMNGL